MPEPVMKEYRERVTASDGTDLVVNIAKTIHISISDGSFSAASKRNKMGHFDAFSIDAKHTYRFQFCFSLLYNIIAIFLQ